ncbi:MauE/DoxX family redox-associated membrane protein [Maridesulfovibrio zosterae]|uniref:MauE/DoxX family redox-associated membrane protein n=1 Tax=Maridesulfovibrio zosterae TaxID=82171 RepID=UPI0003FF574F|nr:MauE/DoxX family redox-associated membrane protein [Maridesulfovibrio zosterae]
MDFKSLPRIILGLVFIFASIDKIIDPVAFAGIIKNYQILPQMMIGPVAMLLPWLEFVCGAMLVCNVLTDISASILIIMLLVFIAALLSTIYRGIDVACGCFSTDAAQISNMAETIGRDVVLLIAAALAFRFKRAESR